MMVGLQERTRHAVRDCAFAFILYLALSLIFFGRTLPGHFSEFYLGRDTDPSLYMWSLEWWLYVIRNHVHPFLTGLVWAPYGLNLAIVTCMPLLGILAAPIEAALGPIASFNLLALMALPLDGLCAYVLCRRIGASKAAALAGGFIFAFSPYMIGQLLSHFVLLLIFPVPLGVYFVVRRLEGSLGRIQFTALLTLTLVVQFLMLLEGLALMTMVGGIALAIALWMGSAEERSRMLAIVPEIAGAYALTALLMSPYLLYFLSGGFPNHPLWPAAEYSADLLNFVIPTPANAVGDNAFLRAISASFPGNIYEQGACLGVPLIMVAIAWTRRHRSELRARVLAATLAITCILALGPYLQIGGHPTSFMPWLLIERIPLLRSAMPVRLMPFAFLIAAMFLSLWLSDPATGTFARAAGVTLTLGLMLPNPAASFWASPSGVPAFFTDGSSRRYLSPNDIVLPLPFGQKGNDMLWQALSGMNFRMASGLTGIQLQQITRWPIVHVFYGSLDLPEPDLQVKAFIANTGITAIVADASDSHVAMWKALLAPLGIQPREISGVLLYQISPGLLDDYRGYTAVAMEQRAARIRFDAAVVAAASYLRSGGALDRMNVPVLEAAGLLPPGWHFDPDATAFRDVWAIPLSHKPAIGVIGSLSAVRPIIDSYGADADAVMFPAPRKWSATPHGLIGALLDPLPANSTSGEDTGLMLMVFKQSRLQEIAARVAAAPALSPASIPREASRLSPSH